MKPQKLKDFLFAINRVVVLPNQYLRRLVFARRARRGERLKVNLGCGQKYVEGMINADGNVMRKIDLWLDLRNRLPFSDGSVAFVYCCHVLEHFFPDDAIRLLKEIRRVITPDGVVRVAVPSFDHAMAIASGEADSQFPRTFADPQAQAVNFLFCEGQHKYAYCPGVLEDFARRAGFGEITVLSPEEAAESRSYEGVRIPEEPRGTMVAELRPGPATQNRAGTT